MQKNSDIRMVDKIEMVAISDLKPYENNARLNDNAVPALMESIKRFGFVVPIVITREKSIVCGHTRVKAASKLGMGQIPCVYADGLTEAEIRALRLADNKVSEIAMWDMEKLDAELASIGSEIDMSDFGFEIGQNEEREGNEEEEEGESEGNGEGPEPKSSRGEVYALGEHRLMCGDSTSKEDWETLMAGEKADITFTSPPYGVSTSSTKLRRHYKRGQKNLKSFYNGHEENIEAWSMLISSVMENCENHSSAQFINIQMLADNKVAIIDILNKKSNRLADIIVWDKQRAAPQMQSCILNNEFEFIFVFNSNGTRSIPFSSFHGTESNIIRISPSKNEYSKIHKAVFPIDLPSKIMSLCSEARSIVDPFCGTGTTIIAAQNLGIKAYGMELDPLYCDIIRKRWAKHVGIENDWESATPVM